MLKSNASSPNAVLFPEFTVAADFCIQTLCVCAYIYICSTQPFKGASLIFLKIKFIMNAKILQLL